MKKYVKWVGIGILIPVFLMIVLCLLFYFPPFQKWAVKQVTAYASQEMGLQISVGHVSLTFPLDLALEDVKVLQPNDSLEHVTDTVADIGRVVADVQLRPLFDKQVMIDKLAFDHMKVNTSNFIPTARIRGTVGHLDLKAHGIDLNDERVNINHASLRDAVLDIALTDTVIPDTMPSENFWKIKLAQLKVEDTDFILHMPGDTLSVKAYLGRTLARNTYMDLYQGLYSVGHLDWDNGRLQYDQNYEPKVEGLDYSHLSLDAIKLKADSFRYCNSKLDMKILAATFREKSGLAVENLQGKLAMDSTRFALPDLNLKTEAGTELSLAYDMDLHAFDDTQPGKFGMQLKGQIGKQDLITIAGNNLPRELARRWPAKPLIAVADIQGNLKDAAIKNLNLVLPGAFKLKTRGSAKNITDPKQLMADLDINAHTYDLGFVKALMDKEMQKTIRLPYGIGLNGRLKIAGSKYASTFSATQGGGSVKGHVGLDADRMAYTAKLNAKALPLQNFLPHMNMHAFTGTIDARGKGTDFMSPATHMAANIRIQDFQYDTYCLDNSDIEMTARNGRVLAHVRSDNPQVKGNFTVDALTRGKVLRGTVSGEFDQIDMRSLNITEDTLLLSACAHIDLASNLKDMYRVRGTMSDITLKNPTNVYRPGTLELDVCTSRDTTWAIVEQGDFTMNMSSPDGYEQFIKHNQGFVTELQTQLKNKRVDKESLRNHLPAARLYLVSGKDNIVSRFLNYYGYGLSSLFVDLTSSPHTGLNGDAYADSLMVNGFQIDTVRFRFISDASNMTYSAQVRNGKNNPDYVFNALLDGSINERGTYAKARIYDWKDSLGIRLALQAAMEQHGVSLHLVGDKPILGYKEFSVNDSNYIFMGDNGRVSANMAMRADDGMGIQIFSNDNNRDVLQDITVSTRRFDIGDVIGMIPFTPDIRGVMNGDFHMLQTPNELTVSSSVNIAKLTYEGNEMGDVGSEFTYMPRPDGGQYVDGILIHNGSEVGVLTGTYFPKGAGTLDATVDLERFPLDLANGFIPDKIIGFKGYAEGLLSIKGSLSSPNVNGEVYLDSTYMFSDPYGVEMRFANDPVTIKNSRLLFENFEMFAHNESALNVQGYFDFANTDRMNMNIRMRANNYLLIDSKENTRSDTYGQAYVNFYGTMQGLLDNLRMRGRLEVLGTTDLKYNLKDSPLSTDNQLDGLVEFVSFEDTTKQVINRPPLTGLNMDMSINIDEGARVVCYLNADHSNYIDIVGGGDMRLRYNPVDEMHLTGRYTIGSGEMKYAMPVIPLKTFTIQENSYIQFRGDPMNPTLNLTATEETKSTVGGSSGDGRVVKFKSGVVVTKTLNDMGLEFIIDAPEDMSIHNQLQVMSKEERGKIAVTMLTTGMYLSDGNTSGFTMNSALSAFLNSQINQISNKALRTLDVSLGVDNSFDNSGMLHTDYSFKFAKRFWNNRLRIVVGGKLSSGADVNYEEETFFDNVTFEYRLSPTSNKYLNLFYMRDDYDWLEGDVSKFGAGFMWKRKLSHFKDIFRFDKGDKLLQPILTDSVRQDTIKK